MTTTGQFEQLFTECGIDWKTLEPEDIVDISHLGIEIESYDIKQKKKVWAKILNLRRQHDAPRYGIFDQETNELLLECNAGHTILVDFKQEPTWFSADKIQTMQFIAAITGPEKTDFRMISCSKLKGDGPVLDVEIEGTATYISNDLISHNTSGGNALKFYASQRLDIRRTGSIGKKGEEISNAIRITVKKNKIFPPFRIAELQIRFGVGIDRDIELIKFASDLGIIDKAGSWYSYKEQRLGQGAENTAQAVKDAGLEEEIRELTWKGLGI